MEVAEMVEKNHADLLRDIKRYVSQLGKSNIAFTDFFLESSYQTNQNKKLPCYLVTKKGCEFIAHKLTGVKGTKFTTWFERMCEYGFVEGKDFLPKMEESAGGRPSTDYDISIDMAKEICMIQRTPEMDINLLIEKYFFTKMLESSFTL